MAPLRTLASHAVHQQADPSFVLNLHTVRSSSAEPEPFSRHPSWQRQTWSRLPLGQQAVAFHFHPSQFPVPLGPSQWFGRRANPESPPCLCQCESGLQQPPHVVRWHP
jgi:hypothetical protein